jgi:ribosomal protein S18 acetylase RimI-like enzyme
MNLSVRGHEQLERRRPHEQYLFSTIGPRINRFMERIPWRSVVRSAATSAGSPSIVRYLALQQCAHPAVESRTPLQLWQIYVLPSFHGVDIAANLMSAALDHARQHQHDVVWLGVSEHNARAIAFYQKHGFQELGLHQVGTDHHAHEDILMSCSVR